MKRSSSLLSLSLISAIASGCGNDSGVTPPVDMGVMATPDMSTPGDTTAPTIVSVTPANDAVGQPRDVEVVFEFSEPMDQQTVEDALDTTSLGAVTLSWNAAGDTLTITPDTELAYATGDGDPEDTEALEYSVTLASSASDLAGNPISAGTVLSFSTRFTTLKEISVTLPLENLMSRVITPSTVEFDVDDDLYVGDTVADLAIRSAITFDLGSLPATATSVVDASFTIGLIAGSHGDPFNDLSDSVVMDHITFPELVDDNAINAAFNAHQSPLSHVGVLYMDSQAEIALDVTAQVADDLANRVARMGRSQYLIRFDAYTDLDGARDDWSWVRDTTELHVRYLVP